MDLPDSGIELGSPVLQVGSIPTQLSGKPDKHESCHQKNVPADALNGDVVHMNLMSFP